MPLSRSAFPRPAIAMALSLAIALVLAGCRDNGGTPAAGAPPAAPPPVTVAHPVVKDIAEWDEFTGRFEAVATVDVRARVGGYLASVHFRDGALVKDGDLLFVIDPRPFQVSLAEAEAAVTSGQTKLDFAKGELERAQQLSRTGATAERTLDERRQQFVSAQADLERARASVAQARLNLSFTEIRSPIAGRISRKLVTEGNLVQANETLLTTIVTPDPIYFYFDVDERTFLSYVRKARDGSRPSGREVAYEVWVALADEREPQHRGKMNFVDNRIDPASGTMRGRAVFDNPTHLLTPGLFGRIRVPASGTYRGVLVPDEAIAADQDRRVVYAVAPDGTVTPKNVRTGPRIDGYRVIRDGLTGEETIIVKGIQRIRAGKVAPQVVTLPPVRGEGTP